jgi:DNA-directed RNA polymerase specialized sigma24 family protein
VARLSDADLAKLLGEVIGELQHRLETDKGRQPELERAARDAMSSLERLVPARAKSDRRRRRTESSSLQEGQRKAVRAALLAGVAPGQVAKHFGLPLAVVRKVLAEAA